MRPIKKFRQIINAMFMAVLGICISAYSQSFDSIYDKPMTEQTEAEAVITDSTDVIEPGTEETETSPELKPVFTPAISTLNLAFYYQENADHADPVASSAGDVLKALTQKDSQWLGSIYELSGTTPKRLAERLGKSPSSLKGLYNPNDELQNKDDPDSWIIQDWNKIDMTFCDETGHTISANSNIKEIMSLANTYFYYSAPEDKDAFLNYAYTLWDKSHSYHYSISDVYYCDGCLEKEEEGSEDAGTLMADAETLMAEAETLAAAVSVPAESSNQESLAVETSEALAAASEASIPETSPVDQMELTESQTSAITESETEREIGPGISLAQAEQSSSTETEVTAIAETETETQAAPVVCPGHVDLHITAVITGLSSSKTGLFSVDSIGSQPMEETGWEGWNDVNRAAAAALFDQDWKELYGLTISSSYISNPLSSSEIGYYMSLLPQDTSEERKAVIRYALSSVGKVPYYWGGKPSAADYEGNQFGSLITADEKGRAMRGLDCSGWVNWVYWSAIQKRLAGESTTGLSGCGTAVKRADLKPGDIILKLGSNAHVVMFLCWENDGQMKVIHESGGPVNNVAVSTMEASWPYYRKLID